MITNQGKTVITNFFGGQTQQLGGALALGVGTTPENLNDTSLAFEVARLPVTAIAPDLANNRLVFKATLPAGQINYIYEVGLYHDSSADRGVTLRLTDALLPDWTGATISSLNARTSGDTVAVTALAANTTQTATVEGISYDLSGFDATDSINIAFTADGHAQSVAVSLGSDSSNYTTWTFTPAVGYNTQRKSISAGVVTGSPDLSAIDYIAIRVDANTAVDTTVYVDDIRLEGAITNDELVARVVLATPKTVDPDLPTEIEYSLGLTV